MDRWAHSFGHPRKHMALGLIQIALAAAFLAIWLLAGAIAVRQHQG